MPQLNITPWFMIFTSSWIIILILLPYKSLAKCPLSPKLMPTRTPKKSWPWPWS